VVDDEPPWQSSWRAAFFDRDSFLPVLLLAVGSMLAFPFADTFRGGTMVIYPFTAGLLLLGMHRSRVRPRTFRLAVCALVAVAVCTALSTLVRALTDVEDGRLVALDMLLYAVLYAIAFPAIVRRAFQHRRVTYNTLAAAICAYIVLGLWFAVIYRGLATAVDAEFFRDVPVPEAGEFVYYRRRPLDRRGRGRRRPGVPGHRGGPHREPLRQRALPGEGPSNPRLRARRGRSGLICTDPRSPDLAMGERWMRTARTAPPSRPGRAGTRRGPVPWDRPSSCDA
jgi:hypothetical protein